MDDNLKEDITMPPPGFSVFEAADKVKFLVHTYMVPATKLSLENTVSKAELQVDDASIGVRNRYYDSILLANHRI